MREARYERMAAEESDAELARKCRDGDPGAWRELVRRFSPLVYRLTLRMLRSPAEAEDASQKTFLRVHRSLRTYDPGRPLAAWVSRIAYHVALRRLGDRSARGVADLDPDELRDESAAGPGEGAEARETESIVDGALDRLSAQDRALVTMRYREGLSDAELAEATGMPVGTVKTRLFRARAALRRLLGPAMGEA
jgi:RNA polymerase sigma-70 factor (ECF subfamily)